MSFEADTIERLIDAPAGSGAYVLGDEAQNQDLYSKIKLLKAVGGDAGETGRSIAKVVRSNLRYWEMAVNLVAGDNTLARRYGRTSVGIAKLAKDLQIAAEHKAAMKEIEDHLPDDVLVGAAKDNLGGKAFKRGAGDMGKLELE